MIKKTATYKLIAIISAMFFATPTQAQLRNFADSLRSFMLTRKFIAGPYLSYAPETRFEIGVSGFKYFVADKNDSITRPSNIRFAAGFTQNKQMLFWLPFEIFTKENRYLIQGQVGYYKYPYFFYGIGNKIDPDVRENYSASFPRFRLELLKLIKPNLYVGFKYWFQHLYNMEYESGKLLESANIIGSRGGANSGLGIAVNYDRRDKIFAPTQGSFIQFNTLSNASFLGSDFTYHQFLIDARKYINLGNLHILALNAYGNFHFGDVPFNRLAMMGGPNRMRGYIEGKYRDMQHITMQAEYRSPIYYFIGYTLFVGTGWISPDFNSYKLPYTWPSYGGGIRIEFDKKQRLFMRMDYALGKNASGFYFTVGEAF